MGAALPGAIAIGLGIWLGFKVYQHFWQTGSSQTNPNAPATPPSTNSPPASALPLNSDYQQPGTSVVLPGGPFFQAPGGPGGASYPGWRGF